MPNFKTKMFEGKFDFPFEVPFVLHEMPDNRIGFEIFYDFVKLLEETPECDDFRMLHSDHTWMAYSTKLDEDGQAIRANAVNPLVALIELRKKIGYGE